MKKVMFTAFAVGLGLTASLWAQVPSYVPTNGLVGWWPFNGNANDESGNGNNGTVNGATLTTDRFGNANKAYSFDGVNDRIEITSSNSLNTLTNVSISYWLNLSSLPSSNIGNGYAGCVTKWFGSGNCNSNTDHFGAWITSESTIKGGTRLYSFGTNMTSSSPIVTVGSTFHICFVHDSSIGGKLFVNGNLVSLVPIAGNLCSTTNNLYIGCDNGLGTLNRFMNGTLDDIGIWNRVLSECEIADLYNSQLGSFSNSNISMNPSLSVIGSNASLTVTSPIQNVQWQSNPSHVGWVNLSDNSNYNGVNNDTLVVSNLQLSNHNQPFRVLACGDTSNIATIQLADTCITNVTVYDTLLTTVTDTLLTTVTDTLIINTTLSLPAPNNENTILIYPNPASDHITIDNGNFSAMAGYSIKIENNAGQQVFQSAINQAQFYVDLSTWTGNGLYFVHLIDPQNNTVTVRKIVLQ